MSERNDAVPNGALIALGALAILDNVHWLFGLHRAVPDYMPSRWSGSSSELGRCSSAWASGAKGGHGARPRGESPLMLVTATAEQADHATTPRLPCGSDPVAERPPHRALLRQVFRELLREREVATRGWLFA